MITIKIILGYSENMVSEVREREVSYCTVASEKDPTFSFLQEGLEICDRYIIKEKMKDYQPYAKHYKAYDKFNGRQLVLTLQPRVPNLSLEEHEVFAEHKVLKYLMRRRVRVPAVMSCDPVRFKVNTSPGSGAVFLRFVLLVTEDIGETLQQYIDNLDESM